MSQRDFTDKYQALLTSIENKIGPAFVESIRQIQGMIDVDQIADLIESGQYTLAMQAVNIALVSAGLEPFTKALSSAFISGGEGLANVTPAIVRPLPLGGSTEIKVGFDIVNPKLSSVLSEYRAGKIREITGDIQATIQDSLASSVRSGINPLEAARDFRSSIGLTAHQERAVQNYKRALLENPNESLNRALRDRRFDRTVRTAFEQGKDIKSEQVNKMVERYRDRYIKHRSEVIARTESIRILNMSNRAMWDQAIEDGKVEASSLKRFWIYTRDKHTREAHRRIPEMNKDGVGQNEAFKSPLGNILFPGDPAASASNTIQCRCTVFTKIID